MASTREWELKKVKIKTKKRADLVGLLDGGLDSKIWLFFLNKIPKELSTPKC